jgi:Raf kinase inhibitor-like YbhB/YbcL family protein
MKQMTLRSAAFSDHAMIPHTYSREAGDVSPPLQWTDVPDEAVELVLVCEDRDAPGGTFVHWLLAGIPPEVSGTDVGEEPVGTVSGRNDFGSAGYGGPHPPIGDDPHRYFFRLFALNRPSDLKPGFTSADVQPILKSAVVATGTVVGTYGR